MFARPTVAVRACSRSSTAPGFHAHWVFRDQDLQGGLASSATLWDTAVGSPTNSPAAPAMRDPRAAAHAVRAPGAKRSFAPGHPLSFVTRVRDLVQPDVSG